MIADTRTSLLDSHPSINVSMDDLDAREFSPTMPDLPSQHSGFRSPNASEYSDEVSLGRRSYSPPAWRKANSGWFQNPPSLSPGRGSLMSREASPQYHGTDERTDRDATIYQTATRIPLPASPVKGRSPSNSPEPEFGGAGENIQSRTGGKVGSLPLSAIRPAIEPDNYIRFTSSIAVQQRTDSIENAIGYLRKAFAHISESKYTAFFYALSTLFAYWLCANLLTTPPSGPVPDLIKVAGLAKSFEPVIYYSEVGHAQISELQDTGLAVWDLSESVRNTNMTTAPQIVTQLENLSDSLKTLSTELTTFFAGLDADVDAILLVMEWAGRELTALSHAPQSTIGSLWSNAHSLLVRTGLISSDSTLIQDLIGQTIQQQTRGALERTFYEFLNVMEESINNEMQYTMQLFSLFEAIDGQFLNLHRTVVREQDTQERIHHDFLSSLWTKVAGVNAARLRKYEKNKDLLQSVRDRTVRNKHVLVEHNQRLLQMKSSLEILRRKLVSPLVRNTNSSSLSIEDQIRGLDGTYQQLKSVRESQKQKKLAAMFGARRQRDALQYGTGMRHDGEEALGISR